MAILTACLLFILIIALMFGADTITLSGAIKMIIIFFNHWAAVTCMLHEC